MVAEWDPSIPPEPSDDEKPQGFVSGAFMSETESQLQHLHLLRLKMRADQTAYQPYLPPDPGWKDKDGSLYFASNRMFMQVLLAYLERIVAHVEASGKGPKGP